MKRPIWPQIRGEVSAQVGMLLLVHKPLQRGPGRSAIRPLPAPLHPALEGHVRSSAPAELPCARSSGQGQSGHPGSPQANPRQGPCWHAVPLAAQAGERGGGPGSRAAPAAGRERCRNCVTLPRSCRGTVRSPSASGQAPCWQGPRCLCPGTRLCLPKTPSPPPSAPPTDPPGTSAPASAAWPRPGQGGRSRSWAGFGVGSRGNPNARSLARHKAQSWARSGLRRCVPGSVVPACVTWGGSSPSKPLFPTCPAAMKHAPVPS